MRIVTVILVLSLLGTSRGMAASEVVKTKDSSKQQKASLANGANKALYLNNPINIDIEKIQVPIFGHDIERLYNGLIERELAARKDEFESTEQQQKRLLEQKNEPLFGSVGLDSMLAFVVKPDVQYDADAQTLRISIPTSSVWKSFATDESRSALRVKSNDMTTRKSTGQNRYGARVAVESTHVIEFNLAIHNQSNFELERIAGKRMSEGMERVYKNNPEILSRIYEGMKKTALVHRLTLTPEIARTVKDKISALALARLTVPYISAGQIVRTATFDDPTAFYNEIKYVDVNLSEIWIFSTQTGEIMAKIKTR